MKICSNCKRELKDNAKFCVYCGTKVQDDLICKKCGEKLSPDMMWCPECGEKVVSEKTTNSSSFSFDNTDFGFGNTDFGFGNTETSNSISKIGDYGFNFDNSIDIDKKLDEQINNKKFEDFIYEEMGGGFVVKGLKNKFCYDITIPDGTIIIDDNAFENSSVITVVLPNTLRRIGVKAFCGSRYLNKINLPENIVEICDEAFKDCESLEITIPKSVRIQGKNITENTLTDITEKQLARERAEQERLEQERLRKQKEEEERLKQEKAEQKRLEKERIRLEKEKAEQEKKRKEKERLEAMRREEERLLKEHFEKLKPKKEGNYYYFGSYPQEYDISTPIAWQILEENSNDVLLMSYYILDAVSFNRKNRTYDEVTNKYDDSRIRKWLNNEFLNSAFVKQQQDFILTSTIGDKNKTYKDKVYILSNSEVKKYLKESLREKTSTKYAKKHGLYVQSDKTASWWTRSNVTGSSWIHDVFTVSSSGKVGSNSDVVWQSADSICGVCPVIRIKKNI